MPNTISAILAGMRVFVPQHKVACHLSLLKLPLHGIAGFDYTIFIATNLDDAVNQTAFFGK
jgi:hypothetical protein